MLEGERRLTADAAHELHAIAAIRAQARVALGAAEPDERRHALQALLAGCDRAARLIEQLLQLARLESATESAGLNQALNLAELAARALAEERRKRQQPSHAFTGTVARPAPDPRLRRPAADQVLLRNLLDNALRYSPPGSAVTVTLAAGTPPGA